VDSTVPITITTNCFESFITSVKHQSNRVADFVTTHKAELLFTGVTLGIASYAPISAVVYCSAGFLMGLNMNAISAKKGILDHHPLPPKGAYLFSSASLIFYSILYGISPASAGFVLGSMINSHIVHYCTKSQKSDLPKEKLPSHEQTQNKVLTFIYEHKAELFFTLTATTTMCLYPKIFFKAYKFILCSTILLICKFVLKKINKSNEDDMREYNKMANYYSEEIKQLKKGIETNNNTIQTIDLIISNPHRKSAYICSIIASLAFAGLNQLVKPVSPGFGACGFIGTIYGTVISKMILPSLDPYADDSDVRQAT
jgi:hypothetical protein